MKVVSGQKNLSLAVPRAVIISFLVVGAFALLSSNSAADINPKTVRGYVWDTDGRVVEAADVTVNIKNGPTTVATLSEPTDPAGYYSLYFDPSDWEVGYTIEVIANFGGNQESDSTAATSAPFQWVNVTFTFAIPEFGSATGLLVTGGLLGAVAVVTLVYSRKR